MKKIVFGVMLTLLLMAMLSLSSNIKPVKGGWTGTVYIRANGSIDPADAPITAYDNVTYTLTDNITSAADGIVVERDNIVIDGNRYTLNGSSAGYYRGIDISGRYNVTIKNLNIQNFYYGVYLYDSSSSIISGNKITANNMIGIELHNSSSSIISGNNITNNEEGVYLHYSLNNTISGNNITANNVRGVCLSISSNNNTISGNNITNNGYGIHLCTSSSNNTISGNNITANNSYGIELDDSSNHTISGNDITNNEYGIELHNSSSSIISGNNITNNGYGVYLYGSSNNNFYHNNFVDNPGHVYSDASTNTWDDGYPSGGNYWSNYTGIDLYCGLYQNETGRDGIGDAPHIIDAYNQDNYPLMKPYPWGPHDIGVTSVRVSKTIVGQGYSMFINVMVFNYGNGTENINVTIYANTAIIGEINNITIADRSSIILTFTWNTTAYAKGSYTIWAYAWPVQGETDTDDNTFVDSVVKVTIPGDVDGDFKVKMDDIIALCNAFGSTIGQPKYNPNLDINNDNKISMDDIMTAIEHFGQHHP